jgi:hypothetical protein
MDIVWPGDTVSVAGEMVGGAGAVRIGSVQSLGGDVRVGSKALSAGTRLKMPDTF